MKFPGLLLCILIMTVMSPCMVRAESPDIDLNPVRVDPGPGRMAELTIRNGGRYAVSVESDSGASLQLVDRITGPGAVSGVPGKADGRLDLFLDPGTYRLRINGDIRDTHPVQIRVIRFEETGPEQRPLPDGEMETTELRDFQERDYWFTVSESRDLYIEAAGRALSDMRLWDEGVFLTRDMPSISASTTTPGQPLTVCRLFVSCTPGTYRLVLYGGQPQPWSVRAAMYPLYLRSGIPELPPAGAVNRSVSIFGEDLFKVSGEPDFFRLDSMVQDTGITVKSFTRDIYPWSLQSARTIQDLKQPYVNWRQTALEDEHLVRISGPAGAAYSFRWFKTLHTDDLGYPDTGPFDLHVVLGGRPRDLPDLNVILVEDSNRREIPPRIVVQSVTEISSDQPVFRRFNIEQPVSLYMDFKDNGSYRFESRGVQSRYILEPLQLVKPLDYVQPLPGPFPDTRDLPAGIYQMIILPDAPGALDLAVIAGEGPARWPASFQSETGRDGHAVLESITFSRDRSYRLLINRTGAPAGYGLLPAGRSGIEEAHVFSAGPETAPKMPAKALEMPILPLNRTVRMNLVPGSAGRMKCRIDQPGIYRLDLDTVEDAETEFRTLLKTTLEGWTRDDRHSVFQNTLIPGEYFLDYSVSDRYFGNFDVRITPVAIYDTGALRPGQTCRIDAGLPGIPSIQLGIEASDQYRVECGNVHTACPVRIETNDNWPAAALIEDRNTVLDLTPGTYRVIPMIRPENRAYRLTVTRLSEPDPVEGAGPHRLNLSEGGAGFWMDDPSIREHLWTFTVNASTRLSLILSDGMEGRLETPADPMRSPIAMIGTAAWSGHVRAGDYRLAVYPSIPDSMKPYHIKVRSDPLISGTRCSVDCPGKTGIALHHPPFASENAGQMLESVPALITVDGPVDTRAVLTDDAGKAVAVVDDVPGDLNPVILLPGVSPSPDSESGETAAHHTLFIEPLNEDSTTCHAACIEPPVEVRQVPSDQSTVMTPGHAALQLMPMETSETDTWVVVTECAGVYGVLPGGIVSGRHLTVCPPGNPSLTLLDVDFRNQNISVFTRRHFVKFTAESSGKRNLRWDTVSIPGGSVFLGEYRVDRPGLFDIETEIPRDVMWVATDTDTFRLLSEYHSSLPVEKVIRLYCSASSNVPPPTTIRRQVLDSQTRELVVPPEAVAEVVLPADSTGLIALRSGHTPRDILKGPGGRHLLDVRSFTGSSGTDPVRLTLTLFPESAMETAATASGARELGPGRVLVIPADPGHDPPAGYAEFGASVIRDSRSCRILNPGQTSLGIAWKPSHEAMVELPEITVSGGDGPRIFLAPGMVQICRFKVRDSRRIGVAVRTTGGRVRAELLPGEPGRSSEIGTGVSEFQGLVMNPYLEAGEYRLKISIAPGDSPAAVQPVLILEPPESLILFGKEAL